MVKSWVKNSQGTSCKSREITILQDKDMAHYLKLLILGHLFQI